jgi:hypothetical protein
MLYTEKPKRIIELALATAYVRTEKGIKEKMVNAALISDSEGGKTTLLRTLIPKINEKIVNKIDNKVRFITDITYSGIINDYLPLIRNDKIRYMVYLDFLKQVNRKDSTVGNFITLLNSLMEEGIIEVVMPNANFKSDIPIKCGVILAMTQQCFNNLAYRGYLTFLQRLLPVSYSYSVSQVHNIKDFIKKGLHLEEEFYTKQLTDKNIKLPYEFTHKFDDTVTNLVSEYKSHNMFINGFRLTEMFLSLLRANALLHNRNCVNSDDEIELQELLPYVTFRMPQLEVKE